MLGRVLPNSRSMWLSGTSNAFVLTNASIPKQTQSNSRPFLLQSEAPFLQKQNIIPTLSWPSERDVPLPNETFRFTRSICVLNGICISTDEKEVVKIGRIWLPFIVLARYMSSLQMWLHFLENLWLALKDNSFIRHSTTPTDSFLTITHIHGRSMHENLWSSLI